MSEFINADCMEYLPNYPDNYFDLAITDPPYGGGSQQMPLTASTATVDASAGGSTVTSRMIRGGGRFDRYTRNQGWQDGRDMGEEVPDERGYL